MRNILQRCRLFLFTGLVIAGCSGAWIVQAQTAPPAAPNAKLPAAAALPDNAQNMAAANADDPLQDAQMRVGIQQSFALKSKLRMPDTNPRDMASLFFNKWQYALLQEAKRGFLANPPSAGGAAGTASRGIRELSLGGIAYRAPKDWTIWLNGQRLQPDALMPQILNLKVTADHIDIKWFDKATNLIFPIRLRPHQRFNMDARIFLPGVGTDKG